LYNFYYISNFQPSKIIFKERDTNEKQTNERTNDEHNKKNLETNEKYSIDKSEKFIKPKTNEETEQVKNKFP